jgi:hypothetical protein
MFKRKDNSKCPNKTCTSFNLTHWYDTWIHNDACEVKCTCILNCQRNNQCGKKCFERFNITS